MNKLQRSVLYDFGKIFLLSALVFCLIPGITLIFSQYTAHNLEEHLISRVDQNLSKDYKVPEKVKKEISQFFHQNHITTLCHSNDGQTAVTLKELCETYDVYQSQFHKIYDLAWWTLVIGSGVFVAVLIFAATAFISRQFQYFSLMLSWWLLMLTTALEAISQGIMLVWLSYWLSSFLLGKIPLQILFIICILALFIVVLAIFTIFKRLNRFMPVEGLPVTYERAGAFWQHIQQLAKTMQTEPPRQIIAGIDPNFFVTESGIAANGANYRGRTLYISLPLLKILSRSEVSAILLHELAHFKGGDTASSAKLSLALQHMGEYCKANLWFFPLRLYLMIFEVARRRDSRDREFLADQFAAIHGLGKELSTSLIKFIYYINFRSLIERRLFAHNKVFQGSVCIAQAIESGITNHDQTTEFSNSMLAAASPHPFDTHPPLQTRLERLGYDAALVNTTIITEVPNQDSWYMDLVDAEAIEQTIWTAFENRFKLIHEQDLAYRYQPADSEEQAVVLKYFPVISVALQKNQTLLIRYDGLLFAETELFIPWDVLSNYQIKDKKLSVYYGIVQINKAKTVVKLKNIDQNKLNTMLQKYWHRHATMRKRNQLGINFN